MLPILLATASFQVPHLYVATPRYALGASMKQVAEEEVPQVRLEAVGSIIEFDDGKHTNTLVQMLDTQLKAAATGEGKRCAQCVLGIETERDKHSLMG